MDVAGCIIVCCSGAAVSFVFFQHHRTATILMELEWRFSDGLNFLTSRDRWIPRQEAMLSSAGLPFKISQAMEFALIIRIRERIRRV